MWLDFERPFVFSNSFESDASICCFYEILRYKSLTALDRLDLMNLEARDITISKNQALLSFHTLGLNNVKVYPIAESSEALKRRWHQDTTKFRVESSRQLIQRLICAILPLLKRRQEVNLDLRHEILSNNLVLAKINDEVCCMAHQLNEKIKTFSNKILLLNYLRNNFGITKEALEEIQQSCNKLTKLMKECRKKGKVQKKNYEFLVHGNIL